VFFKNPLKNLPQKEFERCLPEVAKLLKTKYSKYEFISSESKLTNDEKNGLKRIFVNKTTQVGRTSTRHDTKTSGVWFIYYINDDDKTLSQGNPIVFIYNKGDGVTRFLNCKNEVKKVMLKRIKKEDSQTYEFDLIDNGESYLESTEEDCLDEALVISMKNKSISPYEQKTGKQGKKIDRALDANEVEDDDFLDEGYSIEDDGIGSLI
jgi:hypothetical protein